MLCCCLQKRCMSPIRGMPFRRDMRDATSISQSRNQGPRRLSPTARLAFGVVRNWICSGFGRGDRRGQPRALTLGSSEGLGSATLCYT